MFFAIDQLAADGDFHRKHAAILAVVVILNHIVGARGGIVPHALQIGIVVVRSDFVNPHLQQLFTAVAQADASLLIDIQKAAFAVLQEKRIGIAF